jgi:hypothetical protein
LQKPPRLPIRDLPASDDYAALAVEVKEYRIKNGAFDLSLLKTP